METKTFRKMVGDNCSKPSKRKLVITDLQKKLQHLQATAASIGLNFSEISDARQRLINEAESIWMSSFFGTLDTSFANRTTKVIIGRSENDPTSIVIKDRKGDNDIDVELPVFVSVWNDFDDLLRQFSSIDHKYGTGSSTFTTDTLGRIERIKGFGQIIGIRGTVKMPSGIGSDLFAKIRRCVARMQMFDVFMLHHGIYDEPVKFSPRVGVLWAPTSETWSFRGGDPARHRGDPAIMVKRANDRPCYLVDYFDTPDEKKIDHIIREFTTGKTK